MRLFVRKRSPLSIVEFSTHKVVVSDKEVRRIILRSSLKSIVQKPTSIPYLKLSKLQKSEYKSID